MPRDERLSRMTLSHMTLSRTALSRTAGWGRRLVRDRRASTAIEYAMLAAMVAIVAIGALRAFGDAVDELWKSFGNAIIAAIS